MRHFVFAVSFVASVCCLSATQQASAASVLVDHGSTTYDPNTNLEWLDLTQTLGVSYTAIMSNTGVDYLNQGWRYATSADIAGLFSDAGVLSLPINQTNFSPANFMASKSLIDLLGITTIQDVFGYTSERALGFNIGSASDTSIYVTQVLASTDDTGSDVISGAYDSYGQPSVTSGPALGSFLIRTESVAATPIPATLPLFLSALAGLGLFHWRRGQQPSIRRN
jgi:hypothetical protein